MNLAVKATGSGRRKPVADLKHIGYSNARLDLPDKIFGKAAFIHDMRLAGMVHARVVRQPNRGAVIDKIDEKAITRAAKGKVDFVRIGNFLAVVGDDETAVDLAGAAAVNAVSWQNVEAPTAAEHEANWLLQRPFIDRTFGAPSGRAARPPTFRGDLQPRLSGARFDLAVLRSRGISQRSSYGVDALPGCVPLARIARQGARPRGFRHHRAPRAGLGLLRP